MTLAPEFLGGLVNKYALANSLKPEIVMCVIIQESGGDPLAHRYESNFFEHYLAGRPKTALRGSVPSNVTLDTELRDRAYSYGLMQPMGETARSVAKFIGAFPSLFDPDINITVGCTILSYYLNRENGDYFKCLTSWNAGSNSSPVGQAYAKQTLARVTAGEYLKYFRG